MSLDMTAKDWVGIASGVVMMLCVLVASVTVVNNVTGETRILGSQITALAKNVEKLAVTIDSSNSRISSLEIRTSLIEREVDQLKREPRQ